MITDNIGYKKETTEGTDPISSASVPYYKFGSYADPYGNLPLPVNTYNARYYGSSYSQQLLEHTKQESILQITYIPSDFYIARAVLGANTWNGTTNTMTEAETVDPHTIRFDKDNGTTGIYKSLVAAKFGQNSYTLTRNSYLGATASAMGKKVQNSAVLSSYAPVFRTGQSEADLFKHDSSTVITYDGDSLADVFLDATVMFGMPLKPLALDKSGVPYPDYIDLDDRFTGASFSVTQKDYYAVVEDLIDGNTGDFVLKVYNSAGKYVKFTGADCAVLKTDLNAVLPGVKPGINVQLLPLSFTAEDTIGDYY